jgi:1-acyl-sn-glycerol-3-phosphate acyltransferase
MERYVRRIARRHFAAVRWTGAEPEHWNRALATLFVANHTNWWDGFLALLVTRALGLDTFVLMDAGQLARYPVFGRVGALPLRRGSAATAHADLVAAARVLRRGAGLWIFPQGDRRPAGAPLGTLRHGAAELARRAPAPLQLCPVALRYVFVGEQLPDAFVRVGTPWTVAPAERPRRRPLTAVIADRLAGTLGTLDAALAAEDFAGFAPLVSGRLSVNKRMDRVRHAAGLLDGPFEARNG